MTKHGLVVLFVFGAFHLGATEEDPWLEFLDEVPVSRDVEIRQIQFVLTGNLKEKMFSGLMLLRVGDRYSEEEWISAADFQEKLLMAEFSFYSLEIYNVPLADGGARVVVEAVEGFPYGFNFWPWDLTIRHRNLFGGGETGTLTLGATTQTITYQDWSLGGLPVGSALMGSHRIWYDPRGFLQQDWKGSAGILRRWGPWLETRLILEASRWSYPQNYWALPLEHPALAATKRSQAGISGEPVNSWGGEFHIGTPLAWSALPGMGGGLNAFVGMEFFSGGTQGFKWGGEAKGKVEPTSWLLVTHGSRYLQWNQRVPDPALAVSHGFRIPGNPIKSQGLVVGRTQVYLGFLPSLSLGFTDLRVRPLVFGDYLVDVAPRSASGWFSWSYGGGVDFRFGVPVGLSFLFGYKGSLNVDRRHGFLFEVKTELY